jgi:sugar lactone lactonase YvrE
MTRPGLGPVALCACALALPIPAQATIRRGDIVVADSANQRIVRVKPATGAVKVLSDNSVSTAAGGEADLAFPLDVMLAGNGDVLVADRDAFGVGGVIRVDRSTGAQTAVSSNAISTGAGGTAEFSAPAGIARLKGELYVTDHGSPPKVVQVNPATGAEHLVTADDKLQHPALLAADPAANSLLIADADAFGGPGGVIRVTPASATQHGVSSDHLFDTPSGITPAPNGSVFVTDQSAFGGSGGVIRVNPTTGAQRKVSARGKFEDPYGIARAATGNLIVTDTNGSNPGSGRVFRVDPATGTQHLIADSLYNPLGVAIAP